MLPVKKYGKFYGTMHLTEIGLVCLLKALMLRLITGKKVVKYYSCCLMEKGGVEDTESENVKAWAGANENYTLTEENGKTKLVVDMESTDEFKDYFIKTSPVALEKVKELPEKN